MLLLIFFLGDVVQSMLTMTIT